MSSPTKAAAYHAFWTQFGINAYQEDTVPHDAGFPRLTYSFSASAFEEGAVLLHVNLWYRGEGWENINALSETISETIGRGGVMLPCKGGCIWIKRGSPFSQSMSDTDDDSVRRKYINIEAEFLTAD